MPIRTNRSRDAVYRRLWAWPMRNPARLVGVLAGLAVAAVLTGVVLGATQAPTPAAPLKPATTVTSQASDADRPAGSATSLPATSRAVTSTIPAARTGSTTTTAAGPSAARAADLPEAELAAALTTADAWAHAWTTHPAGITTTAWADQLRPLSTEEHVTQLLRVDPASVPAAAVTGAPTLLDAAASLVTVEVPTDGPRLRLTLLRTPAGWRVDAHDRAEP